MLLWIACIRFAPQLFWISPLVTWIVSICIVAGTLFMLSYYWPVAKQYDASVGQTLEVGDACAGIGG